MLEINDGRLHLIAETSATLLGLFFVGIVFYAESRVRRESSPSLDRYLRSGTRITLLLYAMPLSLAFLLMMVEPWVASVLFVGLSLLLILANIDSAIRYLRLAQGSRSSALAVNEVVSTILVLCLVSLPWILSGGSPMKPHLILSALLSLAAAFLSTCAVVLSIFDAPGSPRSERRSKTASPPDAGADRVTAVPVVAVSVGRRGCGDEAQHPCDACESSNQRTT